MIVIDNKVDLQVLKNFGFKKKENNWEKPLFNNKIKLTVTKTRILKYVKNENKNIILNEILLDNTIYDLIKNKIAIKK